MFTREEDQMLTQLVSIHGESNWKLIASLMTDQNPRQCKERWKHYPSIRNFSREPFTPEEDEIIFQKYIQLGPKWKRISVNLPNRSDIQIRNRWVRFLRHRFNYCKSIVEVNKALKQTTVSLANQSDNSLEIVSQQTEKDRKSVV